MGELIHVTQEAVKLICPLMVLIKSTLEPGEMMTLEENKPNLVAVCGSSGTLCDMIIHLTTWEQMHAATRINSEPLRILGFAQGHEYDPRAYLALIAIRAQTCGKNPNRR